MKKIKDLKPTDKELRELFILGIKNWLPPLKIVGKLNEKNK